jgi:ABC-type molybdate transport system permease subunit
MGANGWILAVGALQEDRVMRHMTGTLLMMLAAFGTAGAVLMAGGSIAEMRRTYPVYRMVVMDQAVEFARYRRMKTILILFASIHLLIALALLAPHRA